MLSQRGYVYILAAGCLVFAGQAFFQTRMIAELIGESDATARELGIRDLGSAIALLASPEPRGAIGARVLYDLSDAALFGRGRPQVAALALGFAAIGLAGLRAR